MKKLLQNNNNQNIQCHHYLPYLTKHKKIPWRMIYPQFFENVDLSTSGDSNFRKENKSETYEKLLNYLL